jgi:putative ABC transport system ATP-binding protein
MPPVSSHDDVPARGQALTATPSEVSTEKLIEIRELVFRYQQAHRNSEFALVIEELQIGVGEKVAFVGPSGSGKTTLLNLLAGISVPDTGIVRVGEKQLQQMSDRGRRDFRISEIGFVFQQFELIEYLSSLDNILLPYRINGLLHLDARVREHAIALATSMGLADKLHRPPNRLSQGEQQRVAICRALINQPRLILADEPTGNLDPVNKRLILQILMEQVQQNGQTLVVVTHDTGILESFDRVIDFSNFHRGEQA